MWGRPEGLDIPLPLAKNSFFFQELCEANHGHENIGESKKMGKTGEVQKVCVKQAKSQKEM